MSIPPKLKEYVDEARAPLPAIRDPGQPLQIGLKHVAPQGEARDPALPLDPDQAGGLELLDVMGQGGGTYPAGLLERAAGGFAVAGAELAQDLVAPRFRQRAGDSLSLCRRQSGAPGGLVAVGHGRIVRAAGRGGNRRVGRGNANEPPGGRLATNRGARI